MTDNKMIIPDKFPVINLATANMVFPHVISQVFLRGQAGEAILKEALEDKHPCVFTTMSKLDVRNIPDRLYDIGVVADLEVVPEDFSVLLRGLYRVKVLSWERSIASNDEEGYWIAKVKRMEDRSEEFFIEKGKELVVHPDSRLFFKAVFSELKKFLEKFVEASGKDDAGAIGAILDNFENYDLSKKFAMDQLIWALLSVIPDATAADKQAVLISNGIFERIVAVSKLLVENIAIIQGGDAFSDALQKKIAADKSKSDNTTGNAGGGPAKNSDNFIQGAHPEVAEKYKKFLEIKQFMSEDAIRSIMDSLKRLKSVGRSRGEASGAEWTVFMTHVDFMLDTPWHQKTEEEADMNKVERVLDAEHYGLNFAKIPILRYLAAKRLNPKGRGDNLLFVGPPGVGKTSLANSIAGALGRKLVRLSLGGVRDEAEIRGHRKTYIGALAGQIMQEMRRAGVKNPVFVLDELDKITTDFRGDPSAALLEVLDPEQNHSFRDHYLDAPYDLSRVLFIATANTTSEIRPALLDRLEPITLPGYTTYEKMQIAKRFLIPKAILNVGLTEHNINLCWLNDEPDETLLSIIKGYTKESGVRNLERRIRTICRSLAQEYLKDKENFKSPVLTQDYLVKVFGQPKYSEERANKTEIGEVIGLAWTPFGGDILRVQSKLYNYQKFSVLQTGMQGKVMIEAGQVALSLLRDVLEKVGEADTMNNKFIHIHVPEGAIEKDGPSAGITTFCSLYSAARKKVARPYIAMTGEVTLTGMVTRIGGVKEKVIAAESAGIKEVIMPETNKRDLDEVPRSAKDKIKFHFVNNIDQVLDIVFEKTNPA